MNIKLAQQVFGLSAVRQADDIQVYMGYPIGHDKLDWNNPDHKLKLIEWLFKWTRKAYEDGNHLDLLDGYRFQIEFAIATNNTEKLVEIAESLLDKGECCE